MAEGTIDKLLEDLQLLKNWNPTQAHREEILNEAIARLRAPSGALESRVAALEKTLEGLDDFNLAMVIHNFRYKIEQHSALLAALDS